MAGIQVLLHWSWVIEISKRFFGKAQTIARVNYVLNLLLFLMITTIIFTGLMISETVMPLRGATEGAADLVVRGRALDAQDLVVIALDRHRAGIIQIGTPDIRVPIPATDPP